MEFEKIVNLDGEELAQQKRQAAEQVFRLRFQMRMGQNEGLKKLRELKKDIARIQTVERQRELGSVAEAGDTAGRKPAKSKPAKTRTRSKSGAKGQTAKKARKSTRAGGSIKAGSTSRAKAPKRGRANAKKGGS